LYTMARYDIIKQLKYEPQSGSEYNRS